MKKQILLASCLAIAALAAAVQAQFAVVPRTSATATLLPPPAAAETVWQKIGVPPESRRLRMIAINNKGHLFVAERFLGFFRSTDSGTSWTPINAGINDKNAWTIDVNPRNGDVIASTYAPRGGGFASYYRSTDNGDHWTKVKGDYRFGNVSAYSGIAIAQNGNLVFAGDWTPFPQSAIWYSTDGGRSSEMAAMNPTATAVMGVAYNPVGKDLWAGTEASGIYRSTDDGRTWNRTFEPRAAGVRMGNIRSFAFTRSGQILLASMTGVWRSTDATGTSWTHVLKNQNVSDGRSLLQDEQFNIYYGHRRDPRNPTAVFISRDGGDTWQPYDSGLEEGLGVEGFALNPVDGRLYIAPDGPDLYRTVNKLR